MRGFLENKQRTPWIFLMVSNNGKKQQLMNFIWKNGRFGMVSYFFLSQVVKHGGCLLLEDWDFQEPKEMLRKNYGDWHPEEGLHIPIPKRSSVLLGFFFGKKTHIPKLVVFYMIWIPFCSGQIIGVNVSLFSKLLDFKKSVVQKRHVRW